MLVIVLGADRDGIDAGGVAAADPEHRQARRVAEAVDRRRDGDRLGALLLGGSRAARVLDADDDGDAVSFGDAVAELSRPGHYYGETNRPGSRGGRPASRRSSPPQSSRGGEKTSISVAPSGPERTECGT